MLYIVCYWDLLHTQCAFQLDLGCSALGHTCGGTYLVGRFLNIFRRQGQTVITSVRDSGRESAFIYKYTWEKSVWATGRPAVVTLFRRLFFWNGMTNSRAVMLIRCHHPINYNVFDRHRCPLVPATARGTRRGRGRVSETPYPGSSTTGWSDCVRIWCVFRDQMAIS